MKVIIVGAHGEAKELINRISSGWSISVIDLDQEKLRNFTTNRQIDKIQGDATSSLVLKKAGLDEATAIVTLTLSDEVNLEILKIAKQNNILRLSSIINDSANIHHFKELDIEIVEPDTLLARRQPVNVTFHPSIKLLLTGRSGVMWSMGSVQINLYRNIIL